MKHKQLNIWLFAQLLALIFGLIGLLCGVLYSFGGLLIDTLVSLGWISSSETPGLSMGTILAFGALIGMPVLFATVGYVLGILLAFFFNLLPKTAFQATILITFGMLVACQESSKPDTSEFQPKTIMALFSHPDDEAVTGVSSLLSKYAREGHTVYLAIATNGDLGVNEHAAIPAGDSLATKRAAEAACTCQALQIKPPVLLGLGDGTLAKDFTAAPLRQKLDSMLQLYQPDVLITWGPDGGYGHMDHRLVHNVAHELVQAKDYLSHTQLWFAGIPADRFAKMPELKSPGTKWMYGAWKPVRNELLDVRAPIDSIDLERGIAAMRCHWSQFTAAEMDDNESWMRAMSPDTVFLRSLQP